MAKSRSIVRKLLVWGPRLVFCIGVGFVLRHVRRLLRRPPRIVHGTFPMHMIHDMVRVDRAAGFPSNSLVIHDRLNESYALVDSKEFDIDLSRRGVAPDELHWAALCHLYLHADIFVHFFDTRFAAPTQPQATVSKLRALRRAGIRLVALPSGLDVIHWTGRTTRFGFLEQLQRDYPDWDLRAEGPLRQATVKGICAVADFVVSGDSACSRYMSREDLRFKYFPVDTQRLRPHVTETPAARPRIVHAPNHRHIKGTDVLLDATRRLSASGLEFELQVVEQVPRREAQALYAVADIVADQFCIGAYGVFALEGLALGKPVVAYLDEEHLGDPVFDLPIVNAHAGNLDQVLAALVAVPALRQRLGQAGRQAVEKVQSIEALAEVWAHIYAHLWWGVPLALDTTRHFSTDRRARFFCEDPSRAEFWPVPVEDLLPDVVAAIEERARVPFGPSSGRSR